MCDKVACVCVCVTPATQKCRGVNRDQGAPSASPDPAQSHKCHACHAKRRWMSPSAAPATQKCRGVTRDQGAPSAPPDPATCQKYHACQAKREPVSEAPRLPRKMQVDVAKCHACHAKVPRRHRRPRGPKRATRPSPVP